jgi:hypothetical protein
MSRHWFQPMLDEADRAIQSIGEFCRRQTG